MEKFRMVLKIQLSSYPFGLLVPGNQQAKKGAKGAKRSMFSMEVTYRGTLAIPIPRTNW